ncbi:MAG: hypothetical protein ABTQ24_09285 [Azonexus sp.]|jgi:hypothetical protein
MKIETTVTITADNGTLYVHADGCDGHIAIPATMERNEQNLRALAILALTPYARKIGAHQPWFASAVADPGVREFVDWASDGTMVLRNIDLLDYLLTIRDAARTAGSLGELRDAIADTVLRATDREAWVEKHHG